MTKVNIAETKAHLSKYINMAEFGGEEIVIQKHGRPVAALINIDLYEKLKKLEEPVQEGKLVYKKLDYRDHLVKSTYTIDEELLASEEAQTTKPYEWCEDPAAYVRHIRSLPRGSKE